MRLPWDSVGSSKPTLVQVDGPADEYVSAPGGLTHKSCVHEVPDGAVVEEVPNTNTFRIVSKGSVVQTIAACPFRPKNSKRPLTNIPNADLPDQSTSSGGLPTINGWIDWASFTPTTNAFGHTAIVKMSGAWTVPPNPSSNGALVYLFNGLVTASGDPIIQPVLQWGTGPNSGSGNKWVIASWQVYNNGTYFVSTAQNVSAGDVIVGQMTGSSCSLGGVCAWTIVTSRGATTTTLSTGSLSAMMQPFLAALEAYSLTSCPQLPGTSATFTDTYAWQIGSSTSSLVEMATAQGWGGHFTVGGSPSCGYNLSLFTRGATLFY